MAQDALLRKLEEVDRRAKMLVTEKDEATAKMRSLEHETNHLRSLISIAESKADEILKGVSTADAPSGPLTPKASNEL
jgi:cell shape-determining protein MreC